MTAGVPLLEMRDVTKTFPGVRALHKVNLSLQRGEIHALTGENGAGKSTLMKILSGAYAADSGAILMEGHPLRISNPNDARRFGIKIIYQELSLATNMSVAENIFLGTELARGGVLVNRARMNRETVRVLERLGAPFRPTDLVGTLSIAEQQQVEIARAIIHESKILIMDEPTATLSEWETERLFQIIRSLRDDGIAVVYISHRMAEIYELADRVSVLRDGEYIGTLDRAGLSAERLIQMMVGRELKDFYKRERNTRAGEVVLDVRGISDGTKVKDVSFAVRRGEVLGLAGLVGAGRTELARLVFGADAKTRGSIILDGKPVTIARPTDAIRAGIGYLPENRKEQGLFLQMSALENIAINVMPENSVAGVVRRRSIARIVAEAIRSLAIRLASPRTAALGLSGGNQQKLLVARWLAIRPRVLLLDEPTRGVDVGAKSEIYRIIGELVAQGVGVVFISSELPEVVGMCDRVLVMRQGQIVAELGPEGAEEITQENIIAYATGTKKAG